MGGVKLKKIIWIITYIFIIYTAIVLYSVIPTRITKDKPLDKDDIKLKVHLEVNSGPTHYVEEDTEKLKEAIKDKYPGKEYPNKDKIYVNLEWNLPYDEVADPASLGDFNVYGKVINVKDSYLGEIFVPVIDVAYTDAKLAPCFRDNSSIMLLYIVLFYPIFLIIIGVILAIVLIKKHRKK